MWSTFPFVLPVYTCIEPRLFVVSVDVWLYFYSQFFTLLYHVASPSNTFRITLYCLFLLFYSTHVNPSKFLHNYKLDVSYKRLFYYEQPHFKTGIRPFQFLKWKKGP